MIGTSTDESDESAQSARPRPTTPQPGPVLDGSRVERTEDAFLVLLTIILVVVAIAQILLRNLFSITLLWADPVVRMLVLWTAFMGALVAARENRHLRIDTILRLLPGGKRRYVDASIYLFNAAVCGLLAVIAVDFVHDEYTYGMQGALDLPNWIFQVIFPLAFGVMSWRFLRRCWSSLRCSSSLRISPIP